MNTLGLNWRLPLYKRYLFYLRTCRNFTSIIQYERRGKAYRSIEIRNGMELNFPNIVEAHGFFRETWFDNIYTKYYKSKHSPKIVVDIGANIGTFTLHSHYVWPESTVFAYEPSSFNYEYLVKNAHTKPSARIYPFNLAVSGLAERKTFFLKEHSGANSFFEAISNHQVKDARPVVVDAIPLEIVLEKANGKIDFLKIDCEGAEWLILPGHEDTLQQIGYVAMEYHIPPDKQLSDLVCIFERAGFEVKTQPPFAWGDWMLGFLYATNRSY